MGENIYKQQLQDALDIDGGLKEDYLPIFYQEIIEECLSLKFPYVNKEIFISNLNVFFSHFFSYKRTRVDVIGRLVYPNYYTIVFSPSGSGKDAVYNTIRRDMGGDFEDMFDGDSKSRYAKKKHELEQYYEDDEEMTDGQKKRAIKEQLRVFPKLVINNATKEGYIHNRESFQYYNFGASMLAMSEFTDYLLSGNLEEKGLMSNLTKSWEDGEDDYMKIKGSDDNIKVKDVPSNFLAFSSIYGLKDSTQYHVFLKNLSRGLGRRSFILVPEVLRINKDDNTLESIERERKGVERGNEMLSYFKTQFGEVFRAAGEEEIMTMTEDATSIYSIYTRHCRLEAQELDGQVIEGVLAETQNRYSKIVRLAAIYAKMDDPTTLVIEPHHLLSAIHWGEYTGKYLAELASHNIENRIARLLIEKGPQNVETIYAMVAPMHKNRTRRAEMFNDMISQIDMFLRKYEKKVGIQLDPTDKRKKMVAAIPIYQNDTNTDEYFE